MAQETLPADNATTFGPTLGAIGHSPGVESKPFPHPSVTDAPDSNPGHQQGTSQPLQDSVHRGLDSKPSAPTASKLTDLPTGPIEGVDYVLEGQAGESDPASLNPSALDAKFTASQLKYMESLKSEYTAATHSGRPGITRSVANHFIAEIANDGKELSSEERVTLHANVRHWFSQRARTRHHNPKFAPPWSARTVFYRDHVEVIAATQKRMYEAALGQTGPPSPGPILEELDLDLVEAAPTKHVNKNGNPTKPFDFLQAAITEEFSKLTDDQRKEYEQCAAKWRAEGPPPEQKRRVAERSAISYVEEFHLEMFKQMGARMFSFVAYRRSDGKNMVSMVDVNKDTGAYHSFSDLIRSALQKSGIYKTWATYSTSVQTRQPDREAAPPAKGSLVPLVLNEYKEPQMPKGWRKPPDGQPRYKWYQELVRSYVTYTQAAATRSLISNHLPSRDQQVRWPHIEKRNDELFDIESISQHPHAGPIKDPGDMNVTPCEHHLAHWEARNSEGLPGLVMIGQLQKDGEIVELPPRREFHSSDVEEAEERARNDASRKKEEQKQKRAASRRAKKSGTKAPGEDGGDEAGKGKGKAKKKGRGKGRGKQGLVEPDKSNAEEQVLGKSNGKGKERADEGAETQSNGPTADVGAVAIEDGDVGDALAQARQRAHRSKRPVVYSEDESTSGGPSRAGPSGQGQEEASPGLEHDRFSPGPLFLQDENEGDWDFRASLNEDSPLVALDRTPVPEAPMLNPVPDLSRPLAHPSIVNEPVGSMYGASQVSGPEPENPTHSPDWRDRRMHATQQPTGAPFQQQIPSATPDDPFISSYRQDHWDQRGAAPRPTYSLPTPYPPYPNHPQAPDTTPPDHQYGPFPPLRTPYYSPAHAAYVPSPHRSFAPVPHHHYPTPPSVSHPPYYPEHSFHPRPGPGPGYTRTGTTPYGPSTSTQTPFPPTLGRYDQQGGISSVRGEQLAQILSALVSPTRNVTAALGNINLGSQGSQNSRSPSTPPPPSPRGRVSIDEMPSYQTPTKPAQRKGKQMATGGFAQVSDAGPSTKRPSSSSTREDETSPSKRPRLAHPNLRTKTTPKPRKGRPEQLQALAQDTVTELTNARDRQLVEEARRLTGCSELNYVRTRKAKVRKD